MQSPPGSDLARRLGPRVGDRREVEAPVRAWTTGEPVRRVVVERRRAAVWNGNVGVERVACPARLRMAGASVERRDVAAGRVRPARRCRPPRGAG